MCAFRYRWFALTSCVTSVFISWPTFATPRFRRGVWSVQWSVTVDHWRRWSRHVGWSALLAAITLQMLVNYRHMQKVAHEIGLKTHLFNNAIFPMNTYCSMVLRRRASIVCFNLIVLKIITNRQRGNCDCIATWSHPTPRQSFSAFITKLCPVWSRWTYPLPYCSVFAADTLLYAVTLTSDLEHLQRIVCDLLKRCTKFERNRAIRSGVIAISNLTQWPWTLCWVLCLALGSFSPRLTIDNLSVPEL